MSTVFKEADAFILVGENRPALRIGRFQAEMSAVDAEKATVATAARDDGVPILGVLGTLQLRMTRLLIVVTESERQGDVFGNAVFRVKRTSLLPSVPPQGDDIELMKLVQSHLDAAPLFYSPTYDLSNCLQRQGQPADSRFVWNWRLAEEFIQYPYGLPWLLPVIYGVFSMTSLKIHGSPVEFGVITRRSRFRAGTRYFRRGLDADGHAANYNETEQILGVGDRHYSYVQTRGSVPAFWGEINQLKYKPTLRVGAELGVDAAAKHFSEQKHIYGKQYLVNLVNQSGYEKPVKDAYENVVAALNDPQLDYVYFDFHRECSKMRWDRVDLLVDELRRRGLFNSNGSSAHNWYAADATGKPLSTQTSVVRTNCMDCLDRTNVVQSCIALAVLQSQLADSGLLTADQDVRHDPSFLNHFRNVWADNADGVSCAYSGTGALKTDFTRTGKRTRRGALQDLWNSIQRYYLNNYRDGPRQDSFSLVTSDWNPLEDSPSSLFADRLPLSTQAVPYVLVGSLIVTVISVVSPNPRFGRLMMALVTLLFGSVSAACVMYVVRHGVQYVNWPRLVPVDFVKWTPGGYQIEGSSLKED